MSAKDGEKRVLDASASVPVQPVNPGEQVSRMVRDLQASKLLDVINGFATANALFTLTESKLLPDLERDRCIDVARAVEAYRYDHRHLLGLLRYLATQDLLKEEAGPRFVPTPRMDAALSRGALGYFRMFIGGYGEVMSRADELLEGKITYGKDLVRDGHYVALGSSMGTSAMVDEVPLKTLERLGARVVADLGCGAGSFLLQWARRHPEHRGIGVDVDPAAVAASTRTFTEGGVADRCRIVQGDGFNLAAWRDACAEADVFYSFAMEHEVLRDGEQAVLGHIDQMAELFPGKKYLLGEPMLHMNAVDGPFYWIHMLTLQGIPRNVPGWVGLLQRLKKARLEEVLVPDHQWLAAYFLIAF